jgi:hypothetical protein
MRSVFDSGTTGVNVLLRDMATPEMVGLGAEGAPVDSIQSVGV